MPTSTIGVVTSLASGERNACEAHDIPEIATSTVSAVPILKLLQC
jgi:hypothetical protein